MVMGMNILPEIFLNKVAEYGDRIAFRKKDFGIWQETSWNEYFLKVRAISFGLETLGFKDHDKLAILVENRPEYLYADLGIICRGGCSAGIYATDSPEQVCYILNHAEAKAVIVEDEEQLDKVLEVRDRLTYLRHIIVIDLEGLRDFSDPMVLSFEELLELGKKLQQEKPELFDIWVKGIKNDDLATIIYTSGTTGLSKGAMLSHSNVIFNSERLVQQMGVNETDSLVDFLPLSHVGGRLCGIYLPLFAGYIVNFPQSRDSYFRALREVSATFLPTVPRVLEKIYSNIVIAIGDSTWIERKGFAAALKSAKTMMELILKGEPPSLLVRITYWLYNQTILRRIKRFSGLEKTRIGLCGAAPISPDVLKFFYSIGVKIKEVYGQTESTLLTSIHLGDDFKFGTVGKACPGTEIKIAEDGEILVRGPGVFLGYLKDPANTAETIKDGWLYSGDVGNIDNDGYLRITDRKKDIAITSAGKNIAPQFIENQLKFSPYIHDAIVVADDRPFPVALIMIDEENVIKYAQDHKIPFTTYKSLSNNEEINKVITGEIDRVNSALSGPEKIKKFRIIDVQLTVDDVEMTSTLKLKRKLIVKKFEGMVTAMYQSKKL